MTASQRHILVAPLDWGLGHTTRCVPLIRHILDRGHKVSFAGNEAQRSYINAALPGTCTLHLDGYNVSYSRSGSGFMWHMAAQLPRLLSTIRTEQEWLRRNVSEHHIDGIISDNRYGLYHSSVPSVIMTHQLQPISGLGSMADSLVRRMHYRHLEKFDECWVVDEETAPGLAGKLSHPSVLPAHAKYIGPLSAIEPVEPPKRGFLLVLLSGPEPQRTLLSGLLWQQALRYPGEVVYVEGSEHAAPPAQIPPHISYHKRVAGNTLAAYIAGAEMVVCRSGYSTIMDLLKLNKKAILVPTPGQTEQEYLAALHSSGGRFTVLGQDEINDAWSHVLSQSRYTTDILPGRAFSLYKSHLDEWLNKH